MAIIEFKKVVECIPSKQQLEVLIEDGTPIDIARVLRITMINEARVNPLDLVDGLNDHHWKVEVLPFIALWHHAMIQLVVLWECLGIKYINTTFKYNKMESRAKNYMTNCDLF
jgi:hypothetical protein